MKKPYKRMVKEMFKNAVIDCGPLPFSLGGDAYGSKGRDPKYFVNLGRDPRFRGGRDGLLRREYALRGVEKRLVVDHWRKLILSSAPKAGSAKIYRLPPRGLARATSPDGTARNRDGAKKVRVTRMR